MQNVLLYSDEDGNWVAECPTLPGCNSGGKTLDEALANIRKALELWIEDALEHHEVIPAGERGGKQITYDRVYQLHERFMAGEFSLGYMARLLGITKPDLYHLLDAMGLKVTNI